ncbi:hypothetical protein KP509_1Z071500 [Ceratopteris richardii]|nr:hypothetical protein KP509_1Z071500 [Ceratopteris richardii]
MYGMAADLQLDLGRSIQNAPVSRKRSAPWWITPAEVEKEGKRMAQNPLGRWITATPSPWAVDLLATNCGSVGTTSERRGGGGGIEVHDATLDLLGGGFSATSRRWLPSVLGSDCLGGEDDTSISSSALVELDSQSTHPLPSGWEKCLDLQTGSIYYLNRSTGITTTSDPRLSRSPIPTSPPSSSSDVTSEGAATGVSAVSQSSRVPTNTRSGSLPSFGFGASEQPACDVNHELDLSLSLKPSSMTAATLSTSPMALKISTQGDQNSDGFRPKSASAAQAFSHERETFSMTASIPNAVNLSCRNEALDKMMPSCSSIGAGTTTNRVSSPRNSSSIDGVSSTQKVQWGDVNLLPSVSQGSSALLTAQNVDQMMNVTTAAMVSNLQNPPSMITVGCANCLMFVMLPQTCNPRCPRCGAAIRDIELPQPSTLKYAPR